MPTPLTIVGASARGAAQSARRAGYEPFGIDLFGDADLAACGRFAQVVDYPQGLPALLAAAPAGPWIYTGGLENHPELVEQMAGLRPLWGNGAEVLRRVRDPLAMAEALQRTGLPVPQVTLDPTGLPVDGSWLRKGRRSTAGSQVESWFGPESATDWPDVYYQQRIHGLPCSALFVAVAGDDPKFLGCTMQLLGETLNDTTGFRYRGSAGPQRLGLTTEMAVRQLGAVVARQFDLRGLFGIDFILADDTPWPVEVNPRYTASAEILERAGGAPMIAWQAAACGAGDWPRQPATPANGPLWGKWIVCAEQNLTWSQALAERVAAANRAAGQWPVFADVPQVGATFKPGDPLLTVLATAECPDSLRAGLAAREDEVRRWLQTAD